MPDNLPPEIALPLFLVLVTILMIVTFKDNINKYFAKIRRRNTEKRRTDYISKMIKETGDSEGVRREIYSTQLGRRRAATYLR